MSEKRFRVCCDGDLGDMWVVDIDTDEEYWTAPSLVDLLNELVKENEQLENENKFLVKQRNYWKAKYEEGTETFESNLAEENKHLEEYCGDLEADVKRFQEKNEQLKQQLDKIPPRIREVWLK